MLADRLEDNTVDDAAPIPRSVKQKIMDHVYRQSGISLDELTNLQLCGYSTAAPSASIGYQRTRGLHRLR